MQIAPGIRNERTRTRSVGVAQGHREEGHDPAIKETRIESTEILRGIASLASTLILTKIGIRIESVASVLEAEAVTSIEGTVLKAEAETKTTEKSRKTRPRPTTSRVGVPLQQ